MTVPQTPLLLDTENWTETSSEPRRVPPLASALVAAVVLAVAGITLAGMAAHVPLWLVALLLAAVGIGLGNTGSLGMLIDAVAVERIVTAMVVWSQVGIIGYLLGPLASGVVAEGPGFAYVGLVPAAAGSAVVACVLFERRPSLRA